MTLYYSSVGPFALIDTAPFSDISTRNKSNREFDLPRLFKGWVGGGMCNKLIIHATETFSPFFPVVPL